MKKIFLMVLFIFLLGTIFNLVEASNDNKVNNMLNVFYQRLDKNVLNIEKKILKLQEISRKIKSIKEIKWEKLSTYQKSILNIIETSINNKKESYYIIIKEKIIQKRKTKVVGLSNVIHKEKRNNYYNYCWEYDCNGSIPFLKLKAPLKFPILEVKNKVKPIGKINAIVVFLYEDNPLPKDKIDILKADKNDIRSFNYAAEWFIKNAEKYNVNVNLNINFSDNQYKIKENYIIHNYNESLSTDLHKYVIDTFPKYSNYDIIIPFYYAAHSYSFANNASISTASFKIFSTKIGNNSFYPSFSSGTTNYSETFAHELQHLFGATDKYSCLITGSKQCKYALKNGVGCIIESGNSNEIGKDIMCHRVPKYNHDFGKNGTWIFINPTLNKLIINDITSKEIGWYDLNGDGVIDVKSK